MPGTKRKMERCREAFDLSDHTLDTLSDKAGVARSTLNNYLKGITEDLKPAVVNRIAAALEITDDESESEPVEQILTHCDRCRADSAERFATMRAAYEDRISAINEKLTQRITDLKEHHAEVQALTEAHHTEKEAKLLEELEACRKENGKLKLRNRIELAILIVLVAAVIILAVVDMSHEQIGWLPYILQFRSAVH